MEAFPSQDSCQGIAWSQEPRDFFVWVNPLDFSVKHNIGLIGSIAQQPVFPSSAEELMFVFNGEHKQGFMSRFHLGVMRHYAIEYELERYRCLFHQVLPSRFHALYLFATREDALIYASAHEDHVRGRVLKRGVTHGQYTFSLHDAAWIDFLRLDGSKDEDTQNFCWRGYWSGERADSHSFQSHGSEWRPSSVLEALFYGRVDFPNKDLSKSD